VGSSTTSGGAPTRSELHRGIMRGRVNQPARSCECSMWSPSGREQG
jgi:hypothetical protein